MIGTELSIEEATDRLASALISPLTDEVNKLVPCPYCLEAPGDPCLTASGDVARYTHGLRLDLARNLAWSAAAPALANLDQWWRTVLVERPPE